MFEAHNYFLAPPVRQQTVYVILLLLTSHQECSFPTTELTSQALRSSRSATLVFRRANAIDLMFALRAMEIFRSDELFEVENQDWLPRFL